MVRASTSCAVGLLLSLLFTINAFGASYAEFQQRYDTIQAEAFSQENLQRLDGLASEIEEYIKGNPGIQERKQCQYLLYKVYRAGAQYETGMNAYRSYIATVEVELGGKMALLVAKRRGLKEMECKNYRDAIEFLRLVAELYNKYDEEVQYAYMKIGECYMKLKDYDKAVEAYDSLIKEKPDGPWLGEAYLGKYRALMKDESRYDDAIAAMRELKERLPETKYAPEAQLNIGFAYYGKKDYEKSLMEYQTVIDEYPKTGEARKAGKMIQRVRAFIVNKLE